MKALFSLGTDSASATLEAVGKAFAVIEFDPSGTIKWANENFCNAMGYSLSEIKGRHHSLFVETSYAESADYASFWSTLRRGECQSQEFRRIGKDGKEVWIQASYTPVVSRTGRVTRIVKIASDITATKQKSILDAGKIEAIERAQAVIEFEPDGTIMSANQNFLMTLGYEIAEITGQHHSMFVDAAYARSSDYVQFWERLSAGEYFVNEFERVGKGGKKVWIQASYNPIFDATGKVRRIVKFATDITARVEAVEALADGLGKLAVGDLQHEITQSFPPALEKLRIDYNESISSLRTVMLSVNEISFSISKAAREISTASDDLSGRTELNAASLEETSTALQDITTTVRKTATGAKHAGLVVSEAMTDAERGMAVVDQAVEGMSKIEKSSAEIRQIIGLIDEITFQTNLLALNAGVEAARAGEAGRGFAVVASEVRGLAQRAADAAKDITDRITASSKQVDDGVELVAETGQALERLVSKVTEINSVVQEISASTEHEATGLQQISEAANKMDRVTQQNAAMAEEATAASRSLAEESTELARKVGQFQLGADPLRSELERVAPHVFQTHDNGLLPSSQSSAEAVDTAQEIEARVAVAGGNK